MNNVYRLTSVFLAITATVQFFGIGERVHHALWQWYKFAGYSNDGHTTLGATMVVATFVLSFCAIFVAWLVYKFSVKQLWAANVAIITLLLVGCSSPGGFVKSSTPDENFIDITGGIDRSLSYKFKVEYRTTTELNQCTTYHLTLGKRIAQQFEFDYYPDIKGSTYSVRLPLQELEPNTPCNWKPVMAFLCVNSAGKEPTSCTSIFSFRGVQDIGPVTKIECTNSNFCSDSESNVGSGAINEFNRTYQVDIVAK